MPLPSDPIRLCIFGDSHIACLRHAVKGRALTDPPVDLEFWGTVGHRFHKISLQDGALVPNDETTADRFAAVNLHGRRSLRPEDFDAILFMGARTRLNMLFAEFLHRARHPDLFLSTGVRREIIRGHLHDQRPYGFARAFAAQGKARILFAPVSFPTEGISTEYLDSCPDAVHGTQPERAAIWKLVREVMAEDGITLLPQPDRSVTLGCFTAAAYATRHAATRGDSTHKNGAYGRLVLRALLPELAQLRKTDEQAA